MDAKQAALEGLHRWQQSAQWSPVVLLPLIIYWLFTDRAPLAIGAGIAGASFYAFARARVTRARCPACETRYGSTPAGSDRIWNEMACDACGLSLFELRRGRARN